MLTLVFENWSVTIPENWNECTGPQLEKIGTLLTSDVGNMTDLELRLRVLRIIGNRSGYWWLRCSADAKYHFSRQVDWLFDDELRLTENKFFRVPLNGRNLMQVFGPKDGLLNCTLAEFHEAEMAYRKLVDGIDGAMDELAAVLWREGKKFYKLDKDPDGDVRVPFTQNTVPWRARLFKRWPKGRKWAIAKMYDGCRLQIMQQFPDVFGAPGGEAAVQESFDGMFKLMRSLAADGKYGTFEQVEQMNLYTAMYELTLAMEEQEEQRSMMQAQETY